MNNSGIFSDVRDNLYLSDVYRYIEQLGKKGHQIGRKVGDMLEVLTLGNIYRKAELKRRCGIDKKVEGFTGAKHAVEFVIYELDDEEQIDEEKILAILECKKVGVEVTTLNKYKNKPFSLTIGEITTHSMSPNWLSEGKNINFRLDSIENDKVNISLSEGNLEVNGQLQLVEGEAEIYNFSLKVGDIVKLPILETEELKILGPDQHLFSIEEHIRNCHFFEIKSISADSCKFSVYECLTGPQTIEKAKQAAFVALDVRKKIDGKWGKEEIEDKDRTFVSCLIIGEASHWEEKSRSVVKTAIDHNIIIPDNIVIKLMQKFREDFGDDNFLNKITKNEFRNDENVESIVMEVIEEFNNKLFYDLNTNRYVDFNYKGGQLIVEEV